MDISVAFPPGWDVKFDDNLKRNYYVDHVNKKTQWDDPRLKHPFIWGETETKKLHKVHQVFPSLPENTIRTALLKSNFDVDQTCLKLSSEGAGASNSLNVSSPSNKRSPSPASRAPSNASQKFATQPRTGAAGPDFLKEFHKNARDASEGKMTFDDMVGKIRSDLKVQPSDLARHNLQKETAEESEDGDKRERRSPVQRHESKKLQEVRRRSSSNRKSGGFDADEFSFMALRSKFIGIPDATIKRALSIHSNDEKAAEKYLKEVQEREQSGSQMPTRTDLSLEDKKLMEEAKLKELMNQLVSEYPAVTETEIKQILVETCSLDIGKAREIFRKKETEQRLAQFKEAATRWPPSEIRHVENLETIDGASSLPETTDEGLTINETFFGKGGSQAKGPSALNFVGRTKTAGRTILAKGHDPSLAKGPSRANYSGHNPANLQYGSFRKYILTT